MLSITTKSPVRDPRADRARPHRRRRRAPVPIGELARRRDIPVQFLEQLFAVLRRAGILRSQRGVKGGYSFARDPGDITVLEVVELLDGPRRRRSRVDLRRGRRRRPGRARQGDDQRRRRAREPRGRRLDVLHLVPRRGVGPAFMQLCSVLTAAKSALDRGLRAVASPSSRSSPLARGLAGEGPAAVSDRSRECPPTGGMRKGTDALAWLGYGRGPKPAARFRSNETSSNRPRESGERPCSIKVRRCAIHDDWPRCSVRGRRRDVDGRAAGAWAKKPRDRDTTASAPIRAKAVAHVLAGRTLIGTGSAMASRCANRTRTRGVRTPIATA